MGNSGSKGLSEQDKAILQLKMQRDNLHKAQTRINLVIEKENQVARQLLRNGQKERAKLALRKKRYQESLIKQVFGQMDTLEQLISTIEFKLIEKDVLYGLQEGNKVLGQLNNEMSLDKVDKILDESDEAIRYQEEITDLLGTRMNQADETAVEEELEALERETAKTVILPDVPTVRVGVEDDKEKRNKEKEDKPLQTQKTPVAA
ncbi:BA75_04931T0 [Komagataella pastoris]|uniref:BA75_04931T0 n=1 Tax=Komagataella pastoris TaxID=4922 RepID=A0A1B2JHG9_PICPA|nr:BA75_04931T0 [Komagataella pastoris]